MTHVPWKERYSIRYQGVDREHKELLAILNQLVGLVGKGAEAGQVSWLFGRICQYAIKHFSAEERFLKASGYSGLAQQEAEHAFFINHILELDRSYDPADPALVEKATHFLKNWFVDHIMKSDQDYADWVRTYHQRAKIRGIIFDLGVVLPDLDPGLVLGRLATLCALAPEALRERFREQASLFSDFEGGSISLEQFQEGLSHLAGRAFNQAECMLLFAENAPPDQTAWAVINDLKPNYPLGLVANANPWRFQSVVQTLGALPLFNAVTASFQVKALKPDPKVFQDVLDKLDLVAEECLFIDRDPASVQAANGCLLHGIHYRDTLELVQDLGKHFISI